MTVTTGGVEVLIWLALASQMSRGRQGTYTVANTVEGIVVVIVVHWVFVSVTN